MLSPVTDKARARRATIVLPEGDDPRIIEGAQAAAAEGLADPVLITTQPHDGVTCINPRASDLLPQMAEAFYDARKKKGISREEAEAAAALPMNFAALMVRTGKAHGTVAGAVATTAETVRTAFQLIGPAPGVKTVSSFFIMGLPQADGSQRPVLFADCGLVIEPDVQQLADIAIATAGSAAGLLGLEPKVALLSFSTKGSAKHSRVDKVTEALAIAKGKAPALHIDGELQFDAALLPAVAQSKAPGSAVAGQANVFVFPSLEAGNIGYKIAQRIGGATAIGPVLQGLAKPANDLSRGCSAEDVTQLIAVTAAQANSEQS